MVQHVNTDKKTQLGETEEGVWNDILFWIRFSWNIFPLHPCLYTFLLQSWGNCSDNFFFLRLKYGSNRKKPTTLVDWNREAAQCVWSGMCWSVQLLLPDQLSELQKLPATNTLLEKNKIALHSVKFSKVDCRQNQQKLLYLGMTGQRKESFVTSSACTSSQLLSAGKAEL